MPTGRKDSKEGKRWGRERKQGIKKTFVPQVSRSKQDMRSTKNRVGLSSEKRERNFREGESEKPQEKE